ncbi:hypothetical protein HMSSN036_52380 [Paenibacillus macerans]|nr:hypothetical protein HMSSN036_52380 [Paenibacillus macerans]
MKRIQRFFIELADGTNETYVTVSSVDTSKTTLSLLGTSGSSSSNIAGGFATIQLVSDTQVLVKRIIGGSRINVSFEVIEHY